MAQEEGLLRVGAWWVGQQKRSLTLSEFRHEFGIYPRTMVFIKQRLGDARTSFLLKGCWWLKVYPTDVQIKYHSTSPTHFREKLWPLLELLATQLPEVKFPYFFSSCFSL